MNNGRNVPAERTKGMTREEIIQQVRRLDPEQLALLKQFLDQLQDLTESPTPWKEPVPEEPGSEK